MKPRERNGPDHRLFKLAEGCAVIEWYNSYGDLVGITVTDLRHTRLAEEGLPE